jgi:hypothetical protein
MQRTAAQCFLVLATFLTLIDQILVQFTRLLKMQERRFFDPFLVDVGGHQHLVTYAEEGFSPLSMHLQSFGYRKEEIVFLADECNQLGEPINLLPELPITIIPRFYVRESGFENAFERCISKIVDDCDSIYNSTQVIFDFRTPNTPKTLAWLVRNCLYEKKKFKNLKVFGFVDQGRSNLLDFSMQMIDCAATINKIFQCKSRHLLHSNLGRAETRKEMKARHWFELVGHVHGVGLLQPRDVKLVLGNFGIDYGGSKHSEYAWETLLPRFLATMTITNYISQLAHSNKFVLRRTFGKILICPEIVGDCPGGCHLHFRPIRFAEIVLRELSKIIGEDAKNSAQQEFGRAIDSYWISAIGELHDLLEKLLVEQDIAPCKGLVIETLQKFDKSALT